MSWSILRCRERVGEKEEKDGTLCCVWVSRVRGEIIDSHQDPGVGSETVAARHQQPGQVGLPVGDGEASVAALVGPVLEGSGAIDAESSSAFVLELGQVGACLGGRKWLK